MEYMGVEFAVRARLGRGNWALTILPKNRGPITVDFIGTRDQAIAAAHRSITRWLTNNRTVPSMPPKPRPPQRWDIYLARHTQAKVLGTVEATDADAAIEAAVKEFGIEAKLLIAVRRG
jgi:hypothetical protein